MGKLKIGVIAESFKTATLEEAFAKASSAGCTGIQLYALSHYLDMLSASAKELKQVRALCDREGLEIVSVCADLGGHGLADIEGNPERIEKLKKIMDSTEKYFSCRILTTHIGVVPADRNSQHYKDMVRDMRTVCEYAASRNMKIAVETGPEPPRALKQFLDDTQSSGAGVNLDPANLTMVHNVDAAESAAILASYIVHTHAKDGVHYQDCNAEEVYAAFAEGGFEALVERTGELFAEKPLGMGQVDWTSYLAELKKCGYCGYLTIEREVGENPEQDIRAAVEFLKKHLK